MIGAGSGRDGSDQGPVVDGVESIDVCQITF